VPYRRRHTDNISVKLFLPLHAGDFTKLEISPTFLRVADDLNDREASYRDFVRHLLNSRAREDRQVQSSAMLLVYIPYRGLGQRTDLQIALTTSGCRLNTSNCHTLIPPIVLDEEGPPKCGTKGLEVGPALPLTLYGRDLDSELFMAVARLTDVSP
jgi:hypothetical protein